MSARGSELFHHRVVVQAQDEAGPALLHGLGGEAGREVTLELLPPILRPSPPRHVNFPPGTGANLPDSPPKAPEPPAKRSGKRPKHDFLIS